MGGKRSQLARAAHSDALQAALHAVRGRPDAALKTALEDGFGATATGEDAFDAFLGTLGLLWCLAGTQAVWQPSRPAVLQLEGWVLGRGAPDCDG